MDEQRVGTLLYAGAAALLAIVGVVFAVRPGGPAPWAYALVALGIVFLGLSSSPRVREHDAYNALGAATATGVCVVAYLRSGVLFVGILVVFSTIGTLVELYNWRAGTTYLRL
ncbi:hypothetical protein JCM30237_14110 [Halolamina litorea]|uniref:Phosphatidate cytidylyltransferase n=1 Tax=Halolamina litorea TaxID=1515593 RepID=A0ABD6BMA6_9EURY|nr:phosphatidate cytidylyltransferase [Halolamina litorea]